MWLNRKHQPAGAWCLITPSLLFPWHEFGESNPGRLVFPLYPSHKLWFVAPSQAIIISHSEGMVSWLADYGLILFKYSKTLRFPGLFIPHAPGEEESRSNWAAYTNTLLVCDKPPEARMSDFSLCADAAQWVEFKVVLRRLLHQHMHFSFLMEQSPLSSHHAPF